MNAIPIHMERKSILTIPLLAYPEMGDAYFALLFMELVYGLENQLQVQAVKENWLMNYELRLWMSLSEEDLRQNGLLKVILILMFHK